MIDKVIGFIINNYIYIMIDGLIALNFRREDLPYG